MSEAGEFPPPSRPEPPAPGGGGGTGWAPGSTWSLVRLLVVVAGGLVAAAVTGTLALVAVLISLFAMVMLHEAGHLLVAKWGGMKVTEYFVGFGPRLWSVRRGETTYGVKAILVGGYVRIIGMSNLEEVDPADEARTYRQSTFPRRVAVSVAGSMVHFVLALLLLWVLFSAVGSPRATAQVEVSGFASMGGTANPARQAGLRPGDVIVSVDGKALNGERQLQSALEGSAGSPVHVVVDRHGRHVPVVVTPVNARAHPEAGAPRLSPQGPPVGAIGVELTNPVVNVRAGPLQGLVSAANWFGNLSWTSIDALGVRFSPHGIGSYVGQLAGSTSTAPSASNPRFESVVGVARLANQAVHAGLAQVLVLLADINVFVGLFNLVPLLPLDGGHVAIALYERVRSRRGRRYHADVAKLLPATYAVILLIVVVGVTAAYLDVTHPLPNPFQ
ncbi:MAG: M50 family metallopeptidase [Acidimicrobiales bacterium]